jgi:hypothetical protein
VKIEAAMWALAVGMTGDRARAEAVLDCWKAQVGPDGLGDGRSIRTVAKSRKIHFSVLARDYQRFQARFQVFSGASARAPGVRLGRKPSR